MTTSKCRSCSKPPQQVVVTSQTMDKKRKQGLFFFGSEMVPRENFTRPLLSHSQVTCRCFFVTSNKKSLTFATYSPTVTAGELFGTEVLICLELRTLDPVTSLWRSHRGMQFTH